MARRPELEALVDDILHGRLSRRALLRRAAALGIAGPSLSALLAACGGSSASEPTSPPSTAPAGGGTPAGSPSGGGSTSSRPLTPTFYQWIMNLHSAIDTSVNAEFSKTHQLNAQIAPVQGFGIDRFVAEARDKNSTWDIYVGMTPFVEMQALIEAGVIEPWDDYMPQEVKDDLIPSIREEATFDGKIYNWPFLLDVVIQGWNAEIVEQAGLDPTKPPADWDEYLANARRVVDSGAAPFGCTFDAHGWRSLAPIAHSISTDVYTEEGLFDFTSDAAVQALEIMKQMMELANPNVLDPGTTDGGVNDTPDEGAFAAQQVAYYVKYQNAHIRMAATWPNPDALQLAALPKAAGGAGATVFWNTGAALFTYGQNKELAAEYMKALTYSEPVFEQSIAGGTEASGHLPVYTSMWGSWRENPPAWMQDWAFLVGDQLPASKAIQTTKYGVTQFNLGQPHWQKYLTGEESDPRQAMQAAMDAVMAEVSKNG